MLNHFFYCFQKTLRVCIDMEKHFQLICIRVHGRCFRFFLFRDASVEYRLLFLMHILFLCAIFFLSFIVSFSYYPPNSESDWKRVQEFFSTMKTAIRDHPSWALGRCNWRRDWLQWRYITSTIYYIIPWFREKSYIMYDEVFLIPFHVIGSTLFFFFV